MSTMETAIATGISAAAAGAADAARQPGATPEQIAAGAAEAALPGVLGDLQQQIAGLESRISSLEAKHPLLAVGMSLLQRLFPHEFTAQQ